jgi:hypothetical protein
VAAPDGTGAANTPTDPIASGATTAIAIASLEALIIGTLLLVQSYVVLTRPVIVTKLAIAGSARNRLKKSPAHGAFFRIYLILAGFILPPHIRARAHESQTKIP